MKPWLIFLIAIAAAALLFCATAALSSCSPPLEITDTRIIPAADGSLCIAWETSEPTVCRMTYCKDGRCYTSEQEPEYGYLHVYSFFEKGIDRIGVLATTKDCRSGYWELDLNGEYIVNDRE